MSLSDFIIYFILIIIYFLCIYYINYFFIKIFFLYENKKLNLYNDFEIIKFNFENDTTNNIKYLELIREKELLDEEYNMLVQKQNKLIEKFTELSNEHGYYENINFVLKDEITETKKILEDLKIKLQYTIGDIEKENYRNILLKTYSLEGLIYEYKNFYNEKKYKKDVYDYQKNLIKDYILHGLLLEYKNYFNEIKKKS